LVIGVDANVDLLREVSHRATRKPVRGGLPNTFFGRLSLEESPGELARLADSLTVLFPWGSLLRAIATPQVGALKKLATLGKPGADIRFLYGYGATRESRTVGALGLPELGGLAALRALERGYAAAGLEVRARYVSREEVASVQSSWAKKLAFSGIERVFVELQGKSGSSRDVHGASDQSSDARKWNEEGRKCE
jgi:16S rRNA (adenine(1408)-N(1))-methyltransferase